MSDERRRRRGVWIFGCLAALVIVAAACSDDGASNAATTAQPSTDSAPVKTPDADGVLPIAARNLAFDAEELQAPTGTLTIRFDNQDGGTPHNVHFFAGDDARGASVGETAIENGRSTQTLEMNLQSGRYYFQCDVHPNMHGTLAVR